jgi:hypothetical protein
MLAISNICAPQILGHKAYGFCHVTDIYSSRPKTGVPPATMPGGVSPGHGSRRQLAAHESLVTAVDRGNNVLNQQYFPWVLSAMAGTRYRACNQIAAMSWRSTRSPRRQNPRR